MREINFFFVLKTRISDDTDMSILKMRMQRKTWFDLGFVEFPMDIFKREWEWEREGETERERDREPSWHVLGATAGQIRSNYFKYIHKVQFEWIRNCIKSFVYILSWNFLEIPPSSTKWTVSDVITGGESVSIELKECLVSIIKS